MTLNRWPLELIKGIGTNHDAPRVVSDVIMKIYFYFRALNCDEDARFCEIVHLRKSSYNTLKEVGLPNDMAITSHMLSIIEKNVC
jgi:hypothetical protein